MKYIIYIIILSFLFPSSLVFGQDNKASPIIAKKKFLNHYSFMQDDERLSYSQLRKLLKEVPVTENNVKIAQALKLPEHGFAYLGSYVLGWAIAIEVAGPNEGGPNWGRALLIGGSLLGTSAFFHAISDAHYKKAIDIYNSEIKDSNEKGETKRMKLILGANSISFSVYF